MSAIIIVSLLIAGGIVYWQRDTIGNWFGQPDKNTNSDSNSVDPSDSDSSISDLPDNDSGGSSNNDGSSDGSSSSSGDSTRQATVIINDASQYGSNIEVRSYVEGVVETDGTCTVTFSKGNQSFSKTTEPLTNPTYTTCATVSVPVSEFPSTGTWQVTVNYVSAKHRGSASKNVEVK